MTSPSNDSILEIMIHNAEEKLSLLKELRQRRLAEKHVPLRYKTKRRIVRGKPVDFLTEVTCSCGHSTIFKVLSTTLDEFECPRKERKEKRSESSEN